VQKNNNTKSSTLEFHSQQQNINALQVTAHHTNQNSASNTIKVDKEGCTIHHPCTSVRTLFSKAKRERKLLLSFFLLGFPC
jgi:hypothetical protein